MNIKSMRVNLVFIFFCLVLAACGKSAEQASPQQEAANACADEAKTRIGDKDYNLDLAALTQSAKLLDGVWQMQVSITIEPGLRDEVKQTLSCEVRVIEGKPGEVTKIDFIYN